MSFQDCVNSGVLHGKINEKEARELMHEFNRRLRIHADPAKAKAEVLQALDAWGEHKLRLALITETVRLKGEAIVFGYHNEEGQNDPAEAVLAMHTRGRRWGRGVMDADNLHKAIHASAMGQINKFVKEFRHGVIIGGGLRRRMGSVRSRLDDIGRAILQEQVADPQAKAIAEAVVKVMEDLRVRAIEAGAEIDKLAYGYLPQNWNASALTNFADRYGMEALLDRIIPELHPERMRDAITGEKLEGDALRDAMREALTNAMTEGMLSEEFRSMGHGQGGALFRHRAHHRFIHFKDFNAWKRVMADFGQGSVYEAIEHHIGALARDIAHMETFGPSPEVLRRYFANLAIQRTVETPTVDGLLSRSSADIGNLLGKVSASAPTPTAPALAELIQLTRHRMRLETASPLAALPHADIPAIQARIQALEDVVNPRRWGVALNAADQTLAARIEGILDDLRDPDTIAGFGNPRAYAEKVIQRADVIWEHMRNQMVTPDDVRVSAAIRSFRDAPDLQRFGRIGAEMLRAPFTGEGMATIRNWITASLGGGFALSSVLSDPVMAASHRAFLGMARDKSSTWRAIAQIFGLFREMSRAELEAAWIAIDGRTSSWATSSRYTGSIDTRMMTGYLADRVLALGGLHIVTAQQRAGFADDFLSFMGKHVGTGWDGLSAPMRDMLSLNGFSSSSWDLLRATPLYFPSSRSIGKLKPDEIARHHKATLGEKAARELAEKYVAMIHRELHVAVPEGDVYSRTFWVGNTKPGTLGGEFLRGAAKFKDFPTAVIFNVLGQMTRDLLGPNGDRMRGARYAGQVLITGTLLGIITIQIKALKDGLDPRQLFDEKGNIDPALIGAAMLQAGGLGIYGDLLFANLNRFGYGLPMTAAGPVASWLDDLRDLTAGNVTLAMKGKETQFGRDAVRVLRRNSPLASLWYLSLAWNRMVMDQLQILWDKDAYASFRASANQRRREHRQDFYWAPGERQPARAPNLDVLRR